MSNGNIYDPTAQVGTAIAERKYKKTQADIEKRKEWAKTARDSAWGLAKAGSKYQREALNVEMFGEMVPGLPKTSMFKLKKTGSLLERVKRDVWRTKEAYELGPSGESFITGVKAKRPAEIEKLTAMGVEPEKYLEKIEGMTKKQPLLKPITPGVKGLTAGKAIAGLQVGAGLYGLADPKGTTAQKVGAGVSTALGINTLLAYGNANLWNPTGPIALAAGVGASLAQSGAFG